MAQVKNPDLSLRRIVAAFAISVALNFSMLAFTAFSRKNRLDSSAVGRFIDALAEPSAATADWLAPGHGGTHILVFLVCAVLYFALVVWILLSLPDWWRNR